MMLRDVIQDDLRTFFEHQRDPEACRMAVFPSRTRDVFMVHWNTAILADPDVAKKTIVIDGEVAGHVVSWGKDGRRFVGYWIGREYWGRGVATEALASFLEHETRRPLHAYVAAQNLGSIRVLEKCGFHRVGESTKALDGVEEVLLQLDR
jgi:RimJ/RimL family protein N-acetyltransferase